MRDDKKKLSPEEFAKLFTLLNSRQMSNRQKDFIIEQSEQVSDLALNIKAKEHQIDDLKTILLETYEPDGKGMFLEVGKFEGYNALQYFYVLGELLDQKFKPVLEKLVMIGNSVKKTIGLAGLVA